MPTTINGQPSSKEIVAWAQTLEDPVFLSFSCGKDSTAVWALLREAHIPVIPVYYYFVPDLEFIQETIEMFEEVFGQRIVQVPHPSLARMLWFKVFQPPERNGIIEAAALPVVDSDMYWNEIRKDFDLPNAWVADGLRATDSLQRRATLTRYGVKRETVKKFSPIADWYAEEVREFLVERQIPAPVDYEIWGQSFDGISAKFMRGLKEHFPNDYEKVLEWFPFADLDILREDTYGKAATRA